MGVPTTSFAVAALIVLAVPGIMFAGIRRWAAGEQPEDRNPGLLFVRGLIFAVCLTAIYFLLLGTMLSDGLRLGTSADQIVVTRPRLIGAIVLVLYILLPAALTLLLVRKDIAWDCPFESRWLKWVKVPRSAYNYVDVPSSWDQSVRGNQNAWVKVLRADGSWVGGWFTRGSHATTYPESPTLYINEQWKMTDGGGFEKAIPDAAVWLAVQDTDIVIWIKPNREVPNEKSSV